MPMFSKKNRSTYWFLPLRTAVIYLVLGCLWILLSDKLLSDIVKSQSLYVTISVVKGWIYVLVTAVLMYALIYSGLRSIKQSANALIESEERYRSLFEQAADGIFTIDISTGFYVEVNQTGCNMLGYSRDELMEMGLNDLIPDENRAAYPPQFEQLTSGETRRFERCIRRKDGGIILVEATVKRIRDHQLQAIVRDISERRRIEETLNTFFDESPVGLAVIDRDYRFVRVNEEMAKINGARIEEHLGQKIEDISSELAEALIPVCNRVFEIGEPIRNLEIGGHTRNVPELFRYFLASYFPIRGIDGRLQFVGAEVVEITDRKMIEEEIHQLNEELEKRVSERTVQLEASNKELESFSYSVSHDLRAPLRGISGFSQALMEEYADRLDETGRHYLNRMHLAGIRMSRLIDDLLKLSRLNRSEMILRDVNLSLLAESIAVDLREVQPERDVTFRIEPDMHVEADERLIRIALENLLGNAWKFTSKLESTQIEFSRLELEGEMVYLIRDNGVGFDMAFADKLFNPFQRLHPESEFEGIGIGLATVQRIIRRHAGRVWAESVVNQGAAFYFTLNVSSERL